MKELQDAFLIRAADIHANSYTGFVKHFTLTEITRVNTVTIFAELEYKLYVNGHFVNSGPAHFKRPHVMADQYDISNFLQKGENDIFILLHYEGCDLKYNQAVEPGLILSLKNDKGLQLNSDFSWEVYPLRCWQEKTCKRNFALGYLEDLDLNHPDAAVLSRYAGDDYYGGKSGKLPFPEKPVKSENSRLQFHPRMQPVLKWQTEQTENITSIFKTCADVHDYENVWSRLATERWDKIYDMEKYNILQQQPYTITRRRGEPGYILEYDLGRICAGEIAVVIETEAGFTLDITFHEAEKNGRPFFMPGSVLYNRVRLCPGLNQYRFFKFNGFRYLCLVIKDLEGKAVLKQVKVHHCAADLAYTDS
ncbi:MAG TPA: hypothetical protein VKS21_00065, partial [Spirochaetota bacterium]|nr:hypothetical protein [Spirochaetota bacterium]